MTIQDYIEEYKRHIEVLMGLRGYRLERVQPQNVWTFVQGNSTLKTYGVHPSTPWSKREYEKEIVFDHFPYNPMHQIYKMAEWCVAVGISQNPYTIIGSEKGNLFICGYMSVGESFESNMVLDKENINLMAMNSNLELFEITFDDGWKIVRQMQYADLYEEQTNTQNMYPVFAHLEGHQNMFEPSCRRLQEGGQVYMTHRQREKKFHFNLWCSFDRIGFNRTYGYFC